nr:lactate utilization protein [Saprospiraceae bacterium]
MHATLAETFNLDESRVDWHDGALWFVRQKRDRAASQVPEWESLRDLASQIKNHTLARLDTYLLELEEKAQQNGIRVHWAADAEEHNRIILGIMQEHGFRKMVKSKSML